MKTTWWIFLALLFVTVANANANTDTSGTYGYGYWVPIKVREYLDLVDASSPATGPVKCEGLYSKVFEKGSLDIRYALGYFDHSDGTEKLWNGINYGMSPSLDIEVFHGLRKELTAPCRTPTLRTCGFTESGDPEMGKVVLEKSIDLMGRHVLVRITMTQASATPSYVLNVGEQTARQKFLTAQSEENFFGGLKTADVVFYNGHSRNGGGPDFNPPILSSNNKVNYTGYYQVQRPGILRTMEALKQNPNKGVVVGFFSCYSRMHFYNTFIKENPKQRLVLSADTIDYFDTLKASVGYLEGILRGSCGQELADTAKKEEKLNVSFQGYNLH